MIQLYVSSQSYGEGVKQGVDKEYTGLGPDQTSGVLVVGATYVITDFIAGDDFTNVGGVNADGSVFVATGTTPTTWTNSSILNSQPALVEGAICFITDRGMFLEDSPTANIKDVKYVRLALGGASGEGMIVSQPIPRNGKVTVKYEVYAAPVKQISFVGSEKVTTPVGSIILDASMAAGDVAIVAVERTDVYSKIPSETRQYYYTITNTDAAGTDQQKRTAIITGIIAAITADAYAFVTGSAIGAAGSEVGLQLTAVDYNTSFASSADGVIKYSTIVTTSTPGIGSEPKDMYVGAGRPWQIQNLELASNVRSGKSDAISQAEYNTWKETSKVCTNTDCGYTIVTLTYDTQPEAIGETIRSISDGKESIKIAIEGVLTTPSDPTGTWAIANSSDVVTVLNSLLPTIFGAGLFVVGTGYEPADDVS